MVPKKADIASGSPEETASTLSESRGFVPPPRHVVVPSVVCVMLAMFVAALSQTIVATIMPVIVADLGGFERYTWAATAYMVSATVAYPIVGRLSDIYGRKRFLIVGLAIFMVGSVLVGLSTSMTQLIGFRALQGIGGGIAMTCCYVSVADLFPPGDRGRFHGLIGAAYGVASIAGPILGGFLADSFSWHWAFILIGIFCIPILALTSRVYPGHNHISRKAELDYPGMALLILAVVPVLFALSSGGVQYDWDDPLIIGLLVFGTGMTGAFLVLEFKVSSPIMPLGIYADRVVGLAVAMSFLASFSLYGSLLFLPLLFQSVLGLSPTTSGNLLAPMILGMVFGGILSGRLLSRKEGLNRLLALSGTGLMTVGMFLLGTVDERTSLFVCVLYIVIAGFGFGGIVATLSVTVQNSVPFELVGTATSALQFFRSLGGLLGLAVLGAAMARTFSSALDEAVPDQLRDVLSDEGLESLKNNPGALGEDSATEELRGHLTGEVPDVDVLLHMLLDALVSSLTEAMDVVFFTVTAVSALSFGVALLFRVPTRRHEERLE